MSSSDLLVSAVICTRNRRRYLEESLDSLLRQSVAPDGYEILVVDNASTDDTNAYLQGVAASTTHLAHLFEERPGLSRARNRALNRARGEIVAFLDDDAVAQENWIERIRSTFEAQGPSVGVLAGRTEPIWEAERPVWLSDQGLGALAIADWGASSGFLSDGQYLVGTNMAFRTELLRSAGGFPEHLGRVGDTLLSGEETFVAELLTELGHRTFYDPSVVVLHHVQRERLARGWFLRRAYWQGVSNANAHDPAASPRLAVTGATILLRLPGCFTRALYFLVRGDPARRFDEQLYAVRSISELSTRLGLSRHGGTATKRRGGRYQSSSP